MFKKGDKVLVTASVYTKDRVSAQIRPAEPYPHEVLREITPQHRGILRPLRRMRYKQPFPGIVVGWSLRKSGEYSPAYGNDDIGCLWQEESHKVIMIQPADTQRWVKPIPCLEEDLVKRRKKHE